VTDLLAEDAQSPLLLRDFETQGFFVRGDVEIARLLAVVMTRQERDLEILLRDARRPSDGTYWAP